MRKVRVFREPNDYPNLCRKEYMGPRGPLLTDEIYAQRDEGILAKIEPSL